MQEVPLVKVGIGVTIYKDGKILLGKRKSAHAGGEYASPGGHLEFGESFEECAKRETMEEAGIQIKNVQFMLLGNLTDYPGKHYVQISLTADWESGEPVVTEENSYESWGWYSLDNLPQPLFKSNAFLLERLNNGRIYFDS